MQQLLCVVPCLGRPCVRIVSAWHREALVLRVHSCNRCHRGEYQTLSIAFLLVSSPATLAPRAYISSWQRPRSRPSQQVPSVRSGRFLLWQWLFLDTQKATVARLGETDQGLMAARLSFSDSGLRCILLFLATPF